MAKATQRRTSACFDCISLGSPGLWTCGRCRAGSGLGQGISELRIHYGPGYRIYFQRRGDTIIVLLCGGNKSTQAKDIKAAKRLADECATNDWSTGHG